MPNWKQKIPPGLKLFLRIQQRRWQDQVNGHIAHFPKFPLAPTLLPSKLQIQQPIRSNAYSENKKQNLNIAIRRMQAVPIQPGQIFSFWHFTPRPTATNGYLPGRNLLGDQLALDVGGGLCQLSGIIYHLALLSGLEIIERYPHSQDIYTEASRYTPLGSDATVVFAYKDLRIRNNLAVPFSFQFELQEDALVAHLCTEAPLTTQQLHFESTPLSKEKVEACVFRVENQQKVLISKDVYVKNNRS